MADLIEDKGFSDRLIYICVSVWVLICCFCFPQLALAQTSIPPNDPNIQYLGRIDRTDTLSPALGWEGCEIRASFTGTSIKMIMSSSGEHYYNIIIDGDINKITKLKLSASLNKTYSLASGLANTIHTVNVIKRTPSLQLQYFKGFILDTGSSLVDPPSLPIRKIEFYGDSQLSGDAIECPTLTDTYEATYFNNYLAYGAVTARLLNAQYSCIAQGGAKLLDISGCYDKMQYFSNKIWDFSQWQADVVVINLGENDYPWTSQWNTNYISFVRKIRQKNPNSYIWLCLGPMFAAKNSDFTNGIAKVKTALQDSKIYTHVFKYSCTPHHPRVDDAAATALELEAEIKKVLWQYEKSIPAPIGLIPSSISGTSFVLSWKASPDSLGITSYEIFENGIFLATTSDTSYSITGLTSSTEFNLTVRALDSSKNASPVSNVLQVYTLSTGISESYLNKLNVFPNPVVDHTLIVDFIDTVHAKEASIQITNMNGRVEYQTTIPAVGNATIQLPDSLVKGIYILSVKTDTLSFTNKIVIE